MPLPPLATAAPVASGSAVEGQTLQTSGGSFQSSVPLHYSYQWQSCDKGDVSGTSCADISGATSSSYTLAVADIDHNVRAVVTAADDYGQSAQQTSNILGPVLPLVPTNTALPLVSGTARQGETLSTDDGSWQSDAPLGPYSYQWLRCDTSGANCQPVAGAIGNVYLLTAADIGSTIRSEVTASNAGGSSLAADSAATAVVVPRAPENTDRPALSDSQHDLTATSPVEQDTLLATPGSWTNVDAQTSYSYQWQRCTLVGSLPDCTDVGSASALASYHLSADDIGFQIRVHVVADNGFATGSADSLVTSPVLPLPPINTLRPAVSGTVQDGSTVSVSNGSWVSSAPLSFTYQWQRCDSSGQTCQDIQGASGQTYVVTPADIDSRLVAVVTAVNSGGSTAALSAPTTLVVPQPPTSTSRPQVSGNWTTGQTATTTDGTWDSAQTPTFTYQWQRCDATPDAAGEGQNCQDIQGATSQSYTIRDADFGFRVRSVVTARNDGGQASASSLPGDVIGGVLPSGSVVIQGSPLVGAVLNADTSSWVGTQPLTFHYQWERCDAQGWGPGGTGDTACPAISGAADSASYTAQAADLGLMLRVKVDVSGPAGSGSAFSDPFGPITTGSRSNCTASQQHVSSSDLFVLDQPLTCDPPLVVEQPSSPQISLCGLAGDSCTAVSASTACTPDTSSFRASWTVEDGNGGTFSWTSDPVVCPSTTPPLPPPTPCSSSATLVNGTDVQMGQDVCIPPQPPFTCDPTTDSQCTNPPSDCNPATDPGCHSTTTTVTTVICTIDVNGGRSCPVLQPSKVNADGSQVYHLPAVNPVTNDGTPYSFSSCTTDLSQASSGTPACQPLVFQREVWSPCSPTPANSYCQDTHYSWYSASTWNFACDVYASAACGDGVGSFGDGYNICVTIPLTGGCDNGSSGNSYQWYQCSIEQTGSSNYAYDPLLPVPVGTGSACVIVSGSPTYVVGSAPDGTGTGTPLDAGGDYFFAKVTQPDGNVIFTSVTKPCVPEPPTITIDVKVITQTYTTGNYPAVGQTLGSASPTIVGTQPMTTSYQWQSSSDGGQTWTDIAGAANPTYTMASSDVGTTLRLGVTVSNYLGSATGYSDATPVIQAPIAPSLLASPTVSGQAQDGNLLVAHTGSFDGTQPMTYAYQWQRCDTLGQNCVDIPQTNAGAYLLTGADIGHTVRLGQTATNAAGATTTYSQASSVVFAAPPSNTSLPGIGGTPPPVPGITLTALSGSWSGSSPINFAYQWQRCDAVGANCADIGLATGAFYVPLASDVGSTLRLGVTASNDAGTASATSPPTTVIQSDPPALYTAPALSATPQQGVSLSTSPGLWTTRSATTFTYQWQHETAAGSGVYSDISGATSSSYTPSLGDVDLGLRARVTATNASGGVDAFTASAVVLPGPPSNTVAPTISGAGVVGQTLTVSQGTWTSARPVTYSYQWSSCAPGGSNCTPIAGATTNSYTLAAADVGFQLEATVTATNAAGSASVSALASAVYATASSYRDVVLGSNPVAYWRLDEAQGATAAADIAGGHTGSYEGGPTLGVQGAVGDGDSAMSLSSSSQDVSVPAGPDFTSSDNKPFSIEIWVKPPSSYPSYSGFADDHVNGTGGWLLSSYTSSGSVIFQAGDGASSGQRYITTGSVLQNGSWNQVVATYDGTRMNLYVNGAQVGTANVSSPIYATTNALRLGAFYNNNNVAVGATGFSFDDASYYNRALPLSEIQTHYSNRTPALPSNTAAPTIGGSATVGQTLTANNGSWSGSPTSYSYQWQHGTSSYHQTILNDSPVSYWRLGESSGTTAADAEGFANGTYVGSPTLGSSGAIGGDADTGISLSADGSQHVDVANKSAYYSSHFSFEAWIKPPATGYGSTYRTIAATEAGSQTSGWVFLVQPNGQLILQVGNGTAGGGYAIGGTPVNGQWNHVVGTFDGSTLRVYLNGTLVATAGSAAPTTNTSPLTMGGGIGGFDEAAYYNTTLSATQVQNHYNAGILGSFQDIQGATGQTYALTSADLGYTLRAAVTAKNLYGSTTAYTAQSNAVTYPAVPYPAPNPIANPSFEQHTTAPTFSNWTVTAPATSGVGLTGQAQLGQAGASLSAVGNGPAAHDGSFYPYLRTDGVGTVGSVAAVTSDTFTSDGSSLSFWAWPSNVGCSTMTVQVLDGSGNVVRTVYNAVHLPTQAWTNYSLSLAADAGQQRAIRFEGGTSCSGLGYGVAFDDITTVGAPIVQFLSPDYSGFGSSGQIAFGSGGGASTQTTCSLDSAAAVPCISPYSFSSLNSGSHTLTVNMSNPTGAATGTVHFNVNFIANSGFESAAGSFGANTFTGWTKTSSGGLVFAVNASNQTATESQIAPHGGSQYLYLRESDASNLSATLTSDAFVANGQPITFWASQTTTAGNASRMTVQVLDGSGNVLSTPFNAVNPLYGWNQYTIPMSAADAGQTRMLRITGGTSTSTLGVGVAFDDFSEGLTSSVFSSTVSSSASAYWRLGESSGTTAFDAKGLSNGTYSGSVSLGEPGAIPNDPDSAVKLTSTSSKVSLGQNAAFDPSHAFTWEVWFKPVAGYPDWVNLMGNTNGTSPGAGMSFGLRAPTSSTGGVLAFQVGDGASGGPYIDSGRSYVSNGVWNYAAATYDGTTLKLYLNGALVSSASMSPKAAATVPLTIGGRPTGAAGGVSATSANGFTFDEAAVYPSALSANTVASHFGLGQSSGAAMYNGDLELPASAGSRPSGWLVTPVTGGDGCEAGPATGSMYLALNSANSDWTNGGYCTGTAAHGGSYSLYMRPSSFAPVGSGAYALSPIFTSQGGSATFWVKGESATCSKFSVDVTDASGNVLRTPISNQLAGTSWTQYTVLMSGDAGQQRRLRLFETTNCGGSGYGAFFDDVIAG